MIEAPLEISYVSLALAVLGVYLLFIGLVSSFLSQKLYISSALVATLIGVAMGPYGAKLVDPYAWCDAPYDWTDFEGGTLTELTFEIMRIVVGIQVLFAGIDLPPRYLRIEWQSLSVLLFIVMTIAFFIVGGLIKALIPGLTFLECLIIGACVTPTDPVLANSIVKGRFAELFVDPSVRNVLSAESGANDGLGFPFIYLPLFVALQKSDKTPDDFTVGTVVARWVVETILYKVIMSVVIGAVVGTAARWMLAKAWRQHMVDRDFFLAFGISLAFAILGLGGIIGTDDILCCFVAGCAVTWHSFYKDSTEADHFRDAIDTLINTITFLYIGAILPFEAWGSGDLGLSPWRLVVLFILVLILRRLPALLALYKIIPSLRNLKEATFVGYFGPIGVSAIYYAMLARKELEGTEREQLSAVIAPVVLFMVLGSCVVHGTTLPIATYGPKGLEWAWRKEQRERKRLEGGQAEKGLIARHKAGSKGNGSPPAKDQAANAGSGGNTSPPARPPSDDSERTRSGDVSEHHHDHQYPI